MGGNTLHSLLGETDEKRKEVGLWQQTGYSELCLRHTLMTFILGGILGGITFKQKL